MFCLYSPCSPSAYLPLQRPMPLWAAPTVPPIGSGIPLGPPGVTRAGHHSLSEEERMESGSREGGQPPSHCRGKDGKGMVLDCGRPFFFLRGAGLPGKRRRCESPGGRSVIASPSTNSPPSPPPPSGLPFNGTFSSELESSFCMEKSPTSFDPRWNSSTSPSPAPPSRNHARSKNSRIEEHQEKEEEEEGSEEDVRRKGDSMDREKPYGRSSPDASPPCSVETSSTVVMTPVAIGNRWPTTPPFDSPRRKGPDSVVVQRRSHHPESPSATAVAQHPVPSSPTPATKHAVLKFGIDSILRSKDAHEVSSEKPHHLPAQHHPHQQHPYSHHHQHHPLGPPPPPPRSHHQSLLSPCIPPPSKPLIGHGNPGPVLGSNFIFTSSAAVYSPHIYALQGQLHYPPSSSSSSSSSSSAASPASVHLRPTVLPPHPSLHYSLHHPFHINGRHSDFAGGTFGLLGSTSDLHSSHHHLHPHSKKKRSWSRAVFSNLQRKGLEKRFEVQKYVTKPDRRQLAAMLGLTDAQVKVWFQNRRMKWRHQEEAIKKKETTEPRKPSSQSPASAPPSRRSPACPTADDSCIELAGIEPDRNVRLRPLTHIAPDESDDEISLAEDVSSANALLSSRVNSPRGLLSSRDPIDGRIHASDAANVAVNRCNGIMSVVDILDLRKESVANNDCGGIDDDDDDCDDEISVISASI